jgi:hypothetical protein
LYAKRILTPLCAARSTAAATIARVASPRLKSYCARSSDAVAPSRNAATARAMSAGSWPPSVRVVISMRSLVDRVFSARIGGTTNFYREGRGAAVRRERLAAYLDRRAGAEVLLVGEAPGYRGARVSGLPFTSERQLTGTGPAEASATIVQRVLAELDAAERVLLWNVVPTHPGTATSNRAPTAAEVAAGAVFARELAHGRRVVAAGRVAQQALGAAYVRHPSRGGAAEFAAGLRALLLP